MSSPDSLSHSTHEAAAAMQGFAAAAAAQAAAAAATAAPPYPPASNQLAASTAPASPAPAARTQNANQHPRNTRQTAEASPRARFTQDFPLAASISLQNRPTSSSSSSPKPPLAGASPTPPMASTSQTPLALPPLQPQNIHQHPPHVFYTASQHHYSGPPPAPHQQAQHPQFQQQHAHHIPIPVSGMHGALPIAPQTLHRHHQQQLQQQEQEQQNHQHHQQQQQQQLQHHQHQLHLQQQQHAATQTLHQAVPAANTPHPVQPHQQAYRLTMPFVTYSHTVEHPPLQQPQQQQQLPPHHQLPPQLSPTSPRHAASATQQPQTAENQPWMHNMIFEYQRMNAKLREALLQTRSEVDVLKSRIADLNHDRERVDAAATAAGSAKQPRRYWTPEEHNRFLEAVRKFGQKDVRAISNYVGTRNPSQVRTHAQKFYLKVARLAERKGGLSKRSMSEGDLLRVGQEHGGTRTEQGAGCSPEKGEKELASPKSSPFK